MRARSPGSTAAARASSRSARARSPSPPRPAAAPASVSSAARAARVGMEASRPLEGGRSRRVGSPLPGALAGAGQGRRRLGVGTDGRGPEVPGMAVGIGLARRQGAMGGPPLGGRGGAVHGRPHEWVAELDATRLDVEEPGGLGGLEVVDAHSRVDGRRGQRPHIGRCRGGGQEKGAAAVGRKRHEPAGEGLLDAGRHRHRRARWHVEQALGLAGQLQHGQRVARGGGEHPVDELRCHRLPGDRGEQGGGVGLAEPAQDDLGQPGPQQRGGFTVACGHDDGDGIRHQPARGEGEGLRGLRVQPLAVVHEHENRCLLGGRGEQPEGGRPEDDAIGRHTRPEPQRAADGGSLRSGQPLGQGGDGAEELVQAGERRTALGLDAARSQDAHAARLRGRGVQQRRLAHPWLPPDDQGPTGADAGVGEEGGEPPAFVVPPEKHGAILSPA